MQNTSPAFAPFAVERDVDCKIRFELLDENAKPNAAPSVSGADIAQLGQLTDGLTETVKYATGEPQSWLLGGGFKILPDSLADAQTGWWSGLSGSDGAFSAAPVLTFGFGGAAISSVGFTLFFDGSAGLPSQIRITTFDAGGAVIAQQTFPNSKAFFVADMPVQNYYSVAFEFLSTAPALRRVRVLECLFGVVQIFNRDSLVSVNFDYAASVIGDALPSRRLVFSFDNSDHKYNLVNPNGLYAYLQQGQNIEASISVNGESVDMGTFEFMSAEASDDEITGQITGNDIVLSELDEATVTGADQTMALSAAVAAIAPGAVLAYPSVSVVTAYREGTSKREALRLLAQASCCSVWVDRDGTLQMRPLEVGEPDDALTPDRMPSLGGVGVSEPVDRVELTVRNEYAETEVVYTAGAGKRIRSIDNPCVAPENGQAVADWLLVQLNRRVKYDKQNRCNPAVEIGDTLAIADAYGEDRAAAVTEISVSFGSGGLTGRTKAVG